MPDRSDAVVITRNPLRGPRRRERYEPRDDGRWMYFEEIWGGQACGWNPVGMEIVEEVTIESGSDLVDGVAP